MSSVSGMLDCPEPHRLAEWILTSKPFGLRHISECRICSRTAQEIDAVMGILAAHDDEVFDADLGLPGEVDEELASMLPEVSGRSPGGDPTKQRTAPSWFTAGKGWRAIAATIAGLAVCLWALMATPVQLPVGREWRGQVTMLTAAAVFDPATAVLELTWRRVDGADRYVVRAWTSAGRLLSERTLTEQTTSLDLPVGTETLRLYWAIDAWAGHTRVGRSGMGETELTHR